MEAVVLELSAIQLTEQMELLILAAAAAVILLQTVRLPSLVALAAAAL